jgi:UDP-N-acetylmuramate-alanine ligase
MIILWTSAVEQVTMARPMDPLRLKSLYNKIQLHQAKSGDLYLVVSVEEQRLFVCRGESVVDEYLCSTSRFGTGNRENSLKTPLGIHRITEKHGAGAPTGRVFRDREDTGEDWDHSQNGDNLILTRILRLEGLEEGVNRGPGIDTYERYIYIHGTGREDLIGTPLSHGCVCLRNHDVVRLFDTVGEGTVVLIDPAPLIVNGQACRSIHFAGIFGSGMSALAQFLRYQGIGVSGSDRFHAAEETTFVRKSLEGLGCVIVPQDGSGIGVDTDAVCVSTAIEDSNPDMAVARGRGIPVLHRSDLLAAIIASRYTIAVAGTSGKSTVTAMIFEFLSACGRSPSLISGAGLRRLERQGLVGNAYSGSSDLLVVEADESDGTLVKYRPQISVVLNVSKDHKSIEEITGLFNTFISQSEWTASNADDPALLLLPASVRFGRNGLSSWRPDREELLPASVRLVKNGVQYDLPLPGEHNLENLRAALCVCERFRCDPQALADAVRSYEGVARRFVVTTTRQNVHVVDDFAHNPAKIAAAVRASRGLSGRIVAVYQPHGFGPTRFLKDEYIETFRSVFGRGDALYLLPIYYAGGTAQKNISSEDIVNGLGAVVFLARAVADRRELLAELEARVKPDDCVLVMGARDPSLPALVRSIVDLFGGAQEMA